MPGSVFDTVLVANRGEIAVRVIRTLRRLGIRSVAVFDDDDAGAPHVAAADLAVRLGGPSGGRGYLDADALVSAARRTGAAAVHPGYGFLAENAAFARAVTAAGLTFVGPPAGAVELMGDKIRAKAAVAAAGVPVVPGGAPTGGASDGGSGPSGDAALAEAAARVGFPVLLKPSAGGGGKGMRLVREPELLAEAIAAARREARSAFGDDTLLLERWIERPRHIEVQVLADDHGHCVHLGERECSLQRRHQKIVEEAPSPLLDEATRAAMGQAAVRVARACGYTGAGTVEFIVPADTPTTWYFMEMNTRLQVEHPVTELITGLDLVEWQLRVAAGEPLPWEQHELRRHGHAVEARICAEDPARGFLPTGGRILALREPGTAGPLPPRRGHGPERGAPDAPHGPHAPDSPHAPDAPDRGEHWAVRTDSGLAPGAVVGSAYDPLLAKVVAHGPDRATALRRLRAALGELCVLGTVTNTGFLRRLLAHPDVVAGRLDTGLVERSLAELLPGAGTPPPEEVLVAAALSRQLAMVPEPDADGWTDPFAVPSGWRPGERAWTAHRLRLTAAGPGLSPGLAPGPGLAGQTPGGTGVAEVRVRGLGPCFEVAVGDGPPRPARATLGAPSPGRGRELRLEWDGLVHTFVQALDEGGDGPGEGWPLWLGRDGDAWRLRVGDPVEEGTGRTAEAGGELVAPMPGTVTVVKAAPGDAVTRGQALLVVEAMKMEHPLTAPFDGTVVEVRVAPGTAVAMEQVLAVVRPDEAPPTDAAPTPEAAATAEAIGLDGATGTTGATETPDAAGPTGSDATGSDATGSDATGAGTTGAGPTEAGTTAAEVAP
ncbi:ATP-binding protein [Allostreptomyces psammosilenae]|uniref:biotin carboxylase n=1 Tax=Allostreptomyces psammosilenae TaxID=1892865 RepID=A0A853AD93_9ACTN|nr:biotin carboxylase N-terminal domain-containing protein [Allostreptomyces psammosilenae]NYI08302.1 acetyl-CoA/propionyl-CoA carboxylase biotin carboxyl carrier protein [Allostreptomyces psammosilenae]